MRIIHTADWHLGRILFGVHLTSDQEFLLDRLFDIIKESEATALFIAGDIYDRAVPPPEAVRLLDDFLSRVIDDLAIPVVVIAGNHDSPDRLGFASRILETRGLFVRGPASTSVWVTDLGDEHGPVSIYALPFAEPSVVREVLDDQDLMDHQRAMAERIARIQKDMNKKQRSILVAHAFVAGSEESESERPLAVGGSAAVDSDLFACFDYVALGHLHRSQKAGNDCIRYSGSLMPYSFSESRYEKSVNLVTLGAKGHCEVKPIPLVPRRRLRIIEGFMDEILKGPGPDENPDDYIQVSLWDTTPILDALGRLRQIYPNLLHIERPHLIRDGALSGHKGDHRKMGDKELFAAFYKEVTGQSLSPSMETSYTDIVNALYLKNREAGV
ncbi:MAG: exonuclease SbcCD subunit D [Proteobacteria bacterium]|nr:exonuclease SbcCD subunit D [Pseudomonadota bacterium]